MSMPTWTRDSAGWYRHRDYPGLFVRPTNQVGYCKWEVVRHRRRARVGGATRPRDEFELLSRNGLLKDAKHSVETEGSRWLAAVGTEGIHR